MLHTLQEIIDFFDTNPDPRSVEIIKRATKLALAGGEIQEFQLDGIFDNEELQQRFFRAITGNEVYKFFNTRV